MICLTGPYNKKIAKEIIESDARAIFIKNRDEAYSVCSSIKKFLGFTLILLSNKGEKDFNFITVKCNDLDGSDFWNEVYDYEIVKINAMYCVRSFNTLSMSYCKNFNQVFKIIDLLERGRVYEKHTFEIENDITSVI